MSANIPVKNHKPHIGIPLVIVACFFNASMAFTVKLISTQYDLPSQALVFFRYTISFLLLLPMLFFVPKYRPLTKTLRIHLWQPYFVRITAGLLSMFAYFYAIQMISLSNAVLLVFTSPFFIPVAFWVWKGVPIPNKLWSGLVVGFIGMLFVIGPEMEHLNIGYLVGLAAGMFAGIAYVAARLQNFTELPIRINFYLFLVSALVSFTTVAKLLIHNLKDFPVKLWWLLVLLGLTGALYQGFIILAFRWTKANYIGAYLYITVVFSVIIDWLYFAKPPTLTSFFGLVLIISGAILMSWLDSNHVKKEAEAPPTN